MDEAFNDFLANRKNETTKFNSLEKELVSLLNESQGESQEVVLQHYIGVIAGVCNVSHSRLLLQLLESAITNNVTTSRYYILEKYYVKVNNWQYLFSGKCVKFYWQMINFCQPTLYFGREGSHSYARLYQMLTTKE